MNEAIENLAKSEENMTRLDEEVNRLLANNRSVYEHLRTVGLHDSATHVQMLGVVLGVLYEMSEGLRADNEALHIVAGAHARTLQESDEKLREEQLTEYVEAALKHAQEQHREALDKLRDESPS